MSVKVRLEAVLFAADQPLSFSRLEEILREDSKEDIKEALAQLEKDYEEQSRAFYLVKVAGGYQLTTRPNQSELVRRLYIGKRRVRLTKAALESLAIIAYKQPTTRPEIDAIRGVSSGGVLETLMERNLVKIAGRAEGVGRPLLYATTPEFLQYLGLNRLKDLPSLSELESMLAEKEAEDRRQEEEELAELAAQSADGEGEGKREGQGGGLSRDATEDQLKQENLYSLEALDAELQVRRNAIDDVAARLETEAQETVEPVDDEPAGARTQSAGEPTPETAAESPPQEEAEREAASETTSG